MSENATIEKLLRPAEVCERLQISRATFYRAAERELPVVKVFGQLRIDPDDLQAWFEECLIAPRLEDA